MPHAVWTPLAQLEFEDILYYIRVADGRPETALKLGEELRTRVDQQVTKRRVGAQARGRTGGVAIS